jgi:hypothetical protein
LGSLGGLIIGFVLTLGVLIGGLKDTSGLLLDNVEFIARVLMELI